MFHQVELCLTPSKCYIRFRHNWRWKPTKTIMLMMKYFCNLQYKNGLIIPLHAASKYIIFTMLVKTTYLCNTIITLKCLYKISEAALIFSGIIILDDVGEISDTWWYLFCYIIKTMQTRISRLYRLQLYRDLSMLSSRYYKMHFLKRMFWSLTYLGYLSSITSLCVLVY